jgi:hypothetical protein
MSYEGVWELFSVCCSVSNGRAHRAGSWSLPTAPSPGRSMRTAYLLCCASASSCRPPGLVHPEPPPPSRADPATPDVDDLAVRRQNSVRRQVIDLVRLIQRKFRLDGHPPAPPAATASPPLRRSPPGRPGEPGLVPPARRLQEHGGPAKGAQERPTLLVRAVEGVGRLEAGSRHRVTQHRPAVAAAPLLRALDQALRPAHRGPPTRQC